MIAEMYLICLGCKRIPDWTNVTTTNENGKIVKHYYFEGMCPHCGKGKFEVVEVRTGWNPGNGPIIVSDAVVLEGEKECRSSVSSAKNVED